MDAIFHTLGCCTECEEAREWAACAEAHAEYVAELQAERDAEYAWIEAQEDSF